ncbi:MAG TPA: VOC family protein [Steroidobacteraceae bacterium]|nr:VOC family protein [Steroidobacteraceae bacterium]
MKRVQRFPRDEVLAAALLIALIFGVVEISQAEPAVRRTTLIVADAAKSIDFYERLGFTKWYDRANARKPELSTLPLNADSTHSRLVIMKGRDPWIAMIGLLEFTEPSPAPVKSDATLGTGDMILMLEVDDAARSYDKLREIGAPIEGELEAYDVVAGDGHKLRGQLFYVRDPDGRLLEVTDPEEE